MLSRGASLREIGEVLRHRKADTTWIYAKVDFGALRNLAQPWPGGVRWLLRGCFPTKLTKLLEMLAHPAFRRRTAVIREEHRQPGQPGTRHPPGTRAHAPPATNGSNSRSRSGPDCASGRVGHGEGGEAARSRGFLNLQRTRARNDGYPPGRGAHLWTCPGEKTERAFPVQLTGSDLLVRPLRYYGFDQR
jgi:hypothetical protein